MKSLVEALPEIYQPILGHPEFNTQARRQCLDRLQILRNHISKFPKSANQIRFLDIGCAQGFFPLSLRSEGLIGQGVGVDYEPRNIAVCNALADEAGLAKDLTFLCENVNPKGTLSVFNGEKFDFGIVFSVLHHVAHDHGLDAALAFVEQLAQNCRVVFLELAVKEEGLYWASSLPTDPKAFLEPFKFKKFLGSYTNHLGASPRPLYVCSNDFAVINSDFYSFDTHTIFSHPYVEDTHRKTRHYFFSNSEKRLIKCFTRQIPENFEEVKNSQKVMTALSSQLSFVPEPFDFEETQDEILIAQKLKSGHTIASMCHDGIPYDSWKVIDTLLKCLVELEKCGYYHHDLRPWNVLVLEDGSAEPIDYGSLRPEWSDSIVDTFVSLCFNIVHRRPPLIPSRTFPWRNAQAFPEPYSRFIDSLNAARKSELNFSRIHELFKNSNLLEPPISPADNLHRIYNIHATAERFYNEALAEVLRDRVVHAQQIAHLHRNAEESRQMILGLQNSLAQMTPLLEDRIAASEQGLRNEIACLKAQVDWLSAELTMYRNVKKWFGFLKPIYHFFRGGQ